MERFRRTFPGLKRVVIGMIHVQPLPGAPLYGGNVQKIIDMAKSEAEVYLKTGIDSIMLENMHDVPYVQAKNFQPETTAVMTRICVEIRKLVPTTMPLGLQILACGNKEALAVALASNFNYIRAEGFVFGHVADEGFTDANAGELLRYRKSLGADDVLIFTDIKKKHSSHAITADVSLVETAKAAEFFLSDSVILTGTATGEPAQVQELNDLKQNCQLPVIIGSGITVKNVHSYLEADAYIIGSHFKTNGVWKETVSEDRVRDFIETLNSFN